MESFDHVSRREFLAAAGVAAAAGGLGAGDVHAASDATPQLAINGGPKAVQAKLRRGFAGATLSASD